MFIPTILKEYLNKKITRDDLNEWLTSADYSYDEVLKEFLDTVTLLSMGENDESCLRFQLFALLEEYNEKIRVRKM